MDNFFLVQPRHADYTLDELMGIACLILEEQQYSFSGEEEREGAPEDNATENGSGKKDGD
jgi:hypothetical protein